MFDVTQLIVPFALGGAGWFATNYIAKPILRLRRLREAVHEEIFFTKNIGWENASGTRDAEKKKEEEARRHQAENTFRRLAAQMSAAKVGWPRYLACYLRILKYDLDKAVKGLTGLSNGLAEPDSHTQFVTQIEKALSLPRSYSDEALRDIHAAWGQRGVHS